MSQLFIKKKLVVLLALLAGCATTNNSERNKQTRELSPSSQLSNQSAAENTSELVSTEVLLTEEKVALLMSGGSSVGVGADVMDPRRLTAWFYGVRPIKTCYNAIESFGGSSRDIESAVRSAVQRWKAYFDKKKITSNSESSVNTNIDFLGVCKGEEDLVLHFGTGPIFGNLKDLKAVQTLSRPVAYVNKTHMSRDLKWGKGYIRFVSQGYYEDTREMVFPDWKHGNSLELVITHELGHVFGFGHAKDTVMDSKIVRDVFTHKTGEMSLAIDGKSELVFCGQCKEKFEPVLNAELRKDFFDGIGLRVKDLQLLRVGEDVSLSDGKKTHPIKFSGLQNINSKSVQLSNFGWDKAGLEQVSFAKFGHIEVQQKKHPVVLSYKGASSSNPLGVELLFLDNGEFKLAGRFVRKGSGQ